MAEETRRRRSFIAIPLPERLCRQIASLQKKLCQATPELKPVARGNLHLTLLFLGDRTQDELAEISSAMLSIGQMKRNFNAVVKGLGFFPDRRRPNIIWLGIHPQTGLLDLHDSLAEALSQRGIDPDPRPYRPHLTIGRFRQPPSQTTALCPFLSHDCGSLNINTMTLFSSKLTAGGAIHTPLQAIPLRGTENCSNCDEKPTFTQ